MVSSSQQLGLGLMVCLRESLFLTRHASNEESDCTNGDRRNIFNFLLCCTPGNSRWKEEQEPKQLWASLWHCCAAPRSTGYMVLPSLTMWKGNVPTPFPPAKEILLNSFHKNKTANYVFSSYQYRLLVHWSENLVKTHTVSNRQGATIWRTVFWLGCLPPSPAPRVL